MAKFTQHKSTSSIRISKEILLVVKRIAQLRGQSIKKTFEYLVHDGITIFNNIFKES